MVRRFGRASDYYTAKLFYIVEVEPAEFDWDELTAYLGPSGSTEPEKTSRFEIQIIDIESGSIVKRLPFENKEEANLKYREIIDDLEEMEVADFAEKYGVANGNLF